MVDLDRTMRRARGYWYEDGLTEIGSGIVFLLVALVFLGELIAKNGGMPIGISAFLLPIAVLAGMLLARQGVSAAKSRITYPRTGYVAYPRPSGRRRLATGILGGVISILTVELLGRLSSMPSLSWIMLIQGGAIAVMLAYIGLKVGVTRMILMAAFSLVCAAVLGLMGVEDSLAEALYFGVMGAGFVLCGALTLGLYLRRTRPQAGE